MFTMGALDKILARHINYLRKRVAKRKDDDVIEIAEYQMNRLVKTVCSEFIELLKYKNYYHPDFPFRIVSADLMEKYIRKNLKKL